MTPPLRHLRLIASRLPSRQVEAKCLQWLQEDRTDAFTPCRVLTPGPVWTAWIKQILLRGGPIAGGISFIHPGRARRMLREESQEALPSSNRRSMATWDLRSWRLLLGQVAEEACREEDIPELEAVRRDSRSLAEASWLCLASGILPQRYLPEVYKILLDEAMLLLTRESIALEILQDFSLWETSLRETPREEHLLVTGFGPQHAALFPLLMACVLKVRSCLIVLDLPEGGAETRAQDWIECWQENLNQEIEWLEEDVVTSLPPGKVETWLAESPAREVDLVLRQMDRANREGNARIACVLPVSGGFASALRSRLDFLEWPHWDTVGGAAADDPANRIWLAWRDLLQQPCLHQANRLLEAWKQYGGQADGLLDEEQLQDLPAFWEEASLAAQTDDIRVLCQYGGDASGQRFTDQFLYLCRQDVPDNWLATTVSLTRSLGLEELAKRIEREGELWNRLWGPRPKTDRVVSWLCSLPVTPTRIPSVWGREPFAPVALLSPDQVVGLPWDRVILAHQSGSCWKAPTLNPLLEEAGRRQFPSAMDRLPGLREVRLPSLPKSSTLRTEWEGILSRLRQTGGGTRLILTASKVREDSFAVEETHTSWFSNAQSESGRTFQWRAGEIPPGAKASAWPAPALTHTARKMRWNRETTFGIFEAATPPGYLHKHPLSVTAWADFIRCPPQAWLQHALGVRPAIDWRREDPSARMRGTWVHGWLAAAGQASLPEGRLDPDAWLLRIGQSAVKLRAMVEEAYNAAQCVLPASWTDRWRESLSIAESMADLLCRRFREGWHVHLIESNLSPGSEYNGLPLRGRVDLVLKSRAPRPAATLIVDFKTGKQAPFQIKRLEKGEGLQLALYLAARSSMEQGRLSALFLSLGPEVEPVVWGEEVAHPLEAWLTSFRGVLEDGIFGYGITWPNEWEGGWKKPLAWLAIPPEVLRLKAAKTYRGRFGDMTGDTDIVGEDGL